MKVEPISVINDENGVSYAVDQCSDNVKRLVDLYNTMRERELEAKEELIVVQCAMKEMVRELTATFNEELRARASAEDTPVVLDAPADPAPADPAV